jgi:outer membrane protein OmpA-like peptidoglycan-associated protein
MLVSSFELRKPHSESIGKGDQTQRSLARKPCRAVQPHVGSARQSALDDRGLDMLGLRAVAAILVLCWLTQPAAAQTPCNAPAWMKSAPAGVRLDSCTVRAWGAMDIPLPDGGRRVFGPWSFVTFLKPDGAQRLGEAALRTPIVAAVTRAGGRLISAADNHTEILLVSGAAGAETYYYYHLLGPEDDAQGVELRTITVAKLPREVETRPLAAPFAVNGNCADPAWLIRAMAMFKRDSCHVWDWASDTVGVADGPERIVEGRKLVVNYTLADETRVPTSAQLQRNFLDAFKAMGATILSSEEDEGHVVAMQAGPAGEVWYLYQCGGGNSEGCGSFSVTTLIVEPFKREVAVRDMPEGLQQTKGCGDPPWLVKQFASYKLDRCDYQDFAPLELTMPDGQTRTLAGRVLVIDYALADEAHIRLPTAIRRNYVDALKEAGATLLTDPNDDSQAILTQKRNGGEYWYIYHTGGGNSEGTSGYKLITLQIGGPPPKSCKMEIYGVNFDFDKSVLRPESEPVLQQVLTLFTGAPAFAADLGGHTDNVGTPAYNLKLSDARAAAVRTWLVGHGVAAPRITSHGYGDTQPLLPNTSDENRFKNRRVELKRADCK